MPPADGTAYYDDLVRNRIALERYSTQQARNALTFLRELEREIVGRLAQYRADGRAALTIRQQEQLLSSVRDLSGEIYGRLQRALRQGMTSLAGSQVTFANDALGKAAGSAGLTFTTQNLSATAAFEIAAARPLQGALLKDWLADLEPSHRARIEQQLRLSFTEGESLSSAMKRMREVTGRNGRGVEALVRTSNAHIAASIDQAVAEANADIIEGVEWVSVLDSRTTDICRSRDGKVYPLDSGPRPPAHIGCRSTTIKRLKGMKPPPRETYQAWLSRQPAIIQDDILGPARGKLFREGKFTVQGFVDMRGRRLTLAELGQ